MATARDLLKEQERIGDKTGFHVTKYTINIDLALDKPYLEGYTICDIIATTNNLETVVLDLAGSYEVTKIDGDKNTFTRKGDKVLVELNRPLSMGDRAAIGIHYKGDAALVSNSNITKGLRYEKHNGDERIIANLSTPFLAHLWFACKDGTYGKADGVAVNITVPELKDKKGNPFIGVSNGLLKKTTTEKGKTTYMWEHNYPIVPYYVMVAVSNYVKLTQDYTDPLGNKFPLEYFVFDEHVEAAKAGTKDMPKVMDFFTNVFGEYPYAKEKYGMTQLGFYSGIENQTNSIVNNMGPSKFYTSVHELAHMWFADAITCSTWQHCWLNEGFASYSEALWDEHTDGQAKYLQNMRDNYFFDAGPLYLPATDSPFRVFVPIVYQKGPWALHILRGIVGDKVFFEGIKKYAQDTRYKHGHATTEDLQAVFEKVSGKRLDYFFQQWIYGENYPEYSYTVEQNPKNFETKLELSQKEWTTKPAIFTLPVQVKIDFQDGTSQIETVWHDAPKKIFNLPTTKKVKAISIDPNEWILRKIKEGTLYTDTKKRFDIESIAVGTDKLLVNFKNGKGKQDIQVSLTDRTGKEVFKNTFEGTKLKKQLEITVPKLTAGNYSCHIIGENTALIRNILVEN